MNDRVLFVIFCVLFLLLCFIEAQLPVLPALAGSWVGEVLKSGSIYNITSGLLISLIAAYFIYLLIEYLPRYKREKRTLQVLNSLVASILDSYSSSNIFGHEKSILYVNCSILNRDWLDEKISVLKSGDHKVDFLTLKIAMETADSRLDDFRNALPLVVTISPGHVMQWLALTEKVKLLANEYSSGPSNDLENLLDLDIPGTEWNDYKNSVAFRLMEFFEEARSWIDIDNK